MSAGPAVPSRRRFLGRSLAVPVSLLAVDAAMSAAGSDAVAGHTTSPTRLGSEDLRAVTVLLEAYCPELGQTTGASAALAASIDELLAVDETNAASGRRQMFLQGLAAATVASRTRFGVALSVLGKAEAATLFAALRSGRLDGTYPLSAWANDVFGHLLPMAALSGPAYAQFESRVFWVLFA